MDSVRLFRRVIAALTLLAIVSPSASAIDALPTGSVEEMIEREQYMDAIDAAIAQLDARRVMLGPDHRETLESLHSLTRAFYGGHCSRLAEELNDYLIDRLPDVVGPRHSAVAEALIRKAHILRVRGESANAAQNFERALGILSPMSHERADLLAWIKQGQAWTIRHGSPEEGLALMKEAFELAASTSAGPSHARMNMATWYGWLLFQAGYPDQAKQYLTLAALDGEALGLESHSCLGVVNELLAGYAIDEGDWEGAERLFRAAAAHSVASRRQQLPGFGRGASPLHHYGSMAVCQIKQGKLDLAWTTLQKSKVGVTTDFMRLSRLPYERPEFVVLTDSLYALTQRYNARVRSDGPGPDTFDLLVRRMRAQARVLRAQQDYLDEHAETEVTVADVQSRLDPRTAYIGWASTYNGLRQHASPGDARAYAGIWCYVIRDRGGIAWFPLAEAFDRETGRRLVALQADVQESLVTAARWPSRVGQDPELLAACRVIASELFDPALPALAGVDRLIVEFGAEDMFKLPIEVLILPDGSFAGDRFATVYTPSAAAFVTTAHDAGRREASEMTALLIGAPIDVASASVDPREIAENVIRPRTSSPAFGSASNLHHARLEIEAISGMFRSTILTGVDATETRLNALVQGGMARYDVIHVATHGLGSEYYEESALALARGEDPESVYDDGMVTADEILYSWKLDAELVTLSACRSASTIQRWRGELLGFSQAMIGAGARSVIGSSWDIDDEAAALFMVRFYENYTGTYDGERMGRSGEAMGKADALREARVWLRNYRNDRGDTPFAHPAYWSGFILIGSPD